ncbi:FGGY-family carbohydrate kinase [Corynebacterium glucuronolyticum]|uniref:FGGY-family carbohydrate kinase n=1 Tax=Corynebacterium glucuronolyticum TaxID=39791 RepID=UPI003F6DC351
MKSSSATITDSISAFLLNYATKSASGTGSYNTRTREYDRELLNMYLGHDTELPQLAAPNQAIGQTHSGALVGPGTGDNMAASLGLDLQPGDVCISIGTSGVASTVSTASVHDSTSMVTGFPDATGVFRGLTTDTSREDIARATVEGILCSMRDAMVALEDATKQETNRVLLIGGGAKSEAIRRIAPAIFGVDVLVPEPGEYVAMGAARQAAWVLSGKALPPAWATQGTPPNTTKHNPTPTPSPATRT